MARKHNTKHQRGQNVRYQKKRNEGLVDGRLADPILSDGKRVSAKR